VITGGVALVLDAPLRSATAATNGSDDVAESFTAFGSASAPEPTTST
jgi:hypothetical protein